MPTHERFQRRQSHIGIADFLEHFDRKRLRHFKTERGNDFVPFLAFRDVQRKVQFRQVRLQLGQPDAFGDIARANLLNTQHHATVQLLAAFGILMRIRLHLIRGNQFRRSDAFTDIFDQDLQVIH
jgi:hypothetical protein